jgi:hypothetical protein
VLVIFAGLGALAIARFHPATKPAA